MELTSHEAAPAARRQAPPRRRPRALDAACAGADLRDRRDRRGGAAALRRRARSRGHRRRARGALQCAAGRDREGRRRHARRPARPRGCWRHDRPRPPPPGPPIGVLVELTHRCPLGCPHCSNPLALERPAAELDTATWKRVFSEAAELGALHVHLSGGEPTARRDIVELTRHAAQMRALHQSHHLRDRGQRETLGASWSRPGLDHAQLSFQGADKATNDRLGHYEGAWEKKRAFAAMVTAAGLPLTVNAVISRPNLHQVGAFIDLALELGARRLEVAHTQYYGWALLTARR